MGVSSIANYGELKAAVADWGKRSDVSDEIELFIRAAHIKIVETVGKLDALQDDADTNNLLNYNPFTYLYGALAQMYLFVKDEEQRQINEGLFQQHLTDYMLSGFDSILGTPQQRVL